MDYAGRNPRNGHIPMPAPPSTLGASYVYNGYMDQARSNNTGSANESSPMMSGQPAGRSNAGVRPMSLFASSGATNSTQLPYAAHLSTAANVDQQHAMTAPNTATSDRSFHAIMIGDNNHTPSRALPSSSAAGSTNTQIRPKHSADAGRSGSMADIYNGMMSSSVPSGSPYLQSEFPRQQEAPDLGSGQAYPQIVYPSLYGTAPGNDQGALHSPGLAPPHHTRTSSHHYSQPHQDATSQMPPGMYTGLAGQAAAMSGALRSSASDVSLSNQPYQASEIVYQTLPMGAHAAGGTSAAQLYPVSQPGLPPAGPASATLSMYASDTRLPMTGRTRSRRRPHHAYDYPDASMGDQLSPGPSPGIAASGTGPHIAPTMRQTLSTNNASDYSNPALRHQNSSEFNASAYSHQGSANSGYGTPNFSPSMELQANVMPASAASPASAVNARVSVYNYPEVSYSPQRSSGPYGSQQHMAEREQRTTGAAWSDRDRSESAMDLNGSSDCETAGAAVTSSDHATASMSSMGDGQQPLDYASTSMAHIRWNPASSGSPLRQEIGASGPLNVEGAATQVGSSQTHVYGTLPRTSYGGRSAASGSSVYGQSLEAQEAASGTGQQQPRPWPRISPQGSGQPHAYTDSPQVQVQTQVTSGPVADYYMPTSPADQLYEEPHTPRAESATLLPMAEAMQGIRGSSSTNMDEINAHSQEYLHRRRRRLTQTMHNRQRSGSAVDPAARLSASRLNATMSLSSPSANSHASNRSQEDARAAEQSPYAYQTLQSAAAYQPPPQPSAARSYADVPVSYMSTDAHPSMQAQAQFQAHAHAQAQLQAQAQIQAQAQLQARAQAEYMQRLQMEQERLQQEQMRLALEQQQQQLKIAQEQELLRFRNYRPLLNLTVDIVETYRKCHPEFYYESARRPRRVLTHPSEGVKNDGFDNANSDYILYVSDVIGEKEGHQYLILEMLGSGTFGQVVKCQNLKTGDLVAVKVIKNKTAYYNQSMMEVQMLDLLNKKYDVEDRHHILRLKEWFVFRNHLVFVNELLSINLYDLLKQNQYQGLSTNLVRVLVQQILDAMIVMNTAQIIHADLKPENILLEGMEKPVIKIIDFGSACFEWQTTFTYIQSRFYRSPEILLGLPYSSRIDMWSLGCIVAELYLGLPLFPGSSEYNQLSRIVDLLGTPPRNMLEKARRTDEFFNYLGPSTWDFKPMEQFSRERNTEEKESKRYFSATTLDELITTYPIRRRISEAEQQREYQSRIALIDFLRGLLQLDPGRRWSPQQASMHPFITGEPYVGPFVPSHNLHDSSGAPGPYGPAPSGSGYSSGSAYHTPQGGDGYGQSHTVGYSAARYAGGQGSNGYTGHTPYARDTSASLFSHPPSPAAASSGLPDTSNLTWAHRTNRQHDSNGSSIQAAASNLLSIPGSFPVNNSSSSGQSHQSSYAGSQSSRPDGRGRLRATTLGHAGGLEHASRISAENTYDHPYRQQQELAGGFLGVDPSTSHMRESLTVDSEPRDAPGRLNISQSNSDYSADNASHDWASRSETNYNSNYPSSNTGSNGTRAGSLYEYKGAGLSVSRQYLVNERQQQRLLQQRQLYQNDSGPLPPVGYRSGGGVADAGSSTGVRLEKVPDYSMSPGSEFRYDVLGTSPALPPSAIPALGQSVHNAPPSRPDLYGHTMRLKPSPALRSHAGARLVSNFSPLTLPSTPGLSGYSQRYASTANDDRFSAEPEMAQQFIDIVTSYDECDDVDDSSDVDSEASSDGQGSSRYSEGSGTSRPLTQARGSETSLSLYSAASERDDAESHGRETDRTGFALLSDSDTHSDGSDDPEYAEALTSIYSMHSDDRWQKFPIPRARQQHGAGPAKHSSLPYALDHPLAEAHSSIYLLPRYAACSQDILDSAGLVFNAQHRIPAVFAGNSDAKENMRPLSGSEDRDWDLEDGFSLADGVDSGSVISQDMASGPESPLSDQDDLDEASESFIRLDVSQSSPDSDDQSSVLFGSIDRYSESSEESDVDNGTRVNQDTVLYVGRPHPLQGLASAGTLSKEHLLGTPQLRQSVQDLASLGDRARPSLDSLHVSPLPVPQSIRCAVAATYPQKIMKWSQHTRSDRPLQSKDSMRMVESLRRMGKWQDSESVQAADELRRANQFFYDPVIIAMSPRLMPQSGQPS